MTWIWTGDPASYVPGLAHVLTDAEMDAADKREPGVKASGLYRQERPAPVAGMAPKKGEGE